MDETAKLIIEDTYQSSTMKKMSENKELIIEDSLAQINKDLDNLYNLYMGSTACRIQFNNKQLNDIEDELIYGYIIAGNQRNKNKSKNYRCMRCFKNFSRKNNLKQHLKQQICVLIVDEIEYKERMFVMS